LRAANGHDITWDEDVARYVNADDGAASEADNVFSTQDKIKKATTRATCGKGR
jgi:hypothetical protein